MRPTSDERPSPRDRTPASSADAGRVELRVRYAETDQMGRVYHTHYLVWCEVGRTELMRRLGTSYGELERRGVFLPVSDLEVDYRRAAEYEDRVRVTTAVERVRSRTVTFAYDLHRVPAGELLARARTELICVDEEGRLCRLPGEVRRVLGERAGGTA